ncbi:restriction endonuclease subunit S [Bacillus mycoides]|uniref:restriction endonuclease subunit S n=1 Tax=Bacillus mycoides TaxID=1405 RepID=UPI0011A8D4AC|nr:restriction endonuclease subunit S [Bacillus mycoides]
MKNNHTPEIRFSGFTGDWVEHKFGDMYDVVSGYAFKMSDYVQRGVPIINGESIQHGSISTKNLNFLPEGFSDKYQNFILDTGDIVLGLNRPITNGKLKIAQVPKDLHGALLYQRAGKIIILNNSNINFSYQLLGNEVSKFVLKEAVGSDQPFISTTKLKKWLICMPALEEEQTEIGNFFKQLDDIITLHQQELTTLKQTKQGFLQKMFPKEGESVPEVRFPGFTGDWEQRNLGDCISYIKGFAFKSEDYRSDGIRLVRVSDLSSNEIKFDNEKIFLDREYENDYKKYKLNVGDIIITTVGSKVELKESAVGRPIIVNKENEGLLNQNLVKISPLNGYNSYFIYRNLLQERYMNYIGSIERGNANQANIAISDLWLYKVYLTSNEEQKQIGNFFKQLDDTIALHQRELDALKETKKAFLQKMFA